MRKTALIICATGLLGLSACTDPYDPGQRALGGAAIGAGTGAAIGAIAGGIAGGTIGNSLDHERGTLYTSEAQATTTVVVAQPPPPPPPQPEVVYAQPDPGVVWISGYWAYDGARYVWIGGRWARPPHRRYHAYVQPHWEPRGGNYVYIQGYWR